MSGTALLIAVFLACAVEAVEAATIVLAVGSTRDWRSTWIGVGLALVVLAVVVAALGPALVLLPIAVLRLVVGALLAIFGLQWLRKAVLRATGVIPLHDETAIYERTVRTGSAAAATQRGLVSDWYAFTVAGKGVLLEGLEVAFIVVTFAANQGNLGLAVIGAGAAVVVVAAAAAWLRAPLASIPENTLKFAVGVLLTSFGVFWATEGTGVAWPGEEAALLWLIPTVLACALALPVLLRRLPAGRTVPNRTRPGAAGSPAAQVPASPGAARRITRRLRGFGRFWYEFVVGDDWRIALAVALALAVTAGLGAAGVALWWLPGLAAVAALAGSVTRAARLHRAPAPVS